MFPRVQTRKSRTISDSLVVRIGSSQKCSSVFLILIVLLSRNVCQCQSNSGGNKGYLYIPPGYSKQDGIVLRPIDHDQLPPGEYEIVATFDKQHKSPAEAFTTTTVNPSPKYDPSRSPFANSEPSPFELPEFEAVDRGSPYSSYPHHHHEASTSRPRYESSSINYKPSITLLEEEGHGGVTTSTSNPTAKSPYALPLRVDESSIVIPILESQDSNFKLPPRGDDPRYLTPLKVLEPPDKEYKPPVFENFPAKSIVRKKVRSRNEKEKRNFGGNNYFSPSSAIATQDDNNNRYEFYDQKSHRQEPVEQPFSESYSRPERSQDYRHYQPKQVHRSKGKYDKYDDYPVQYTYRKQPIGYDPTFHQRNREEGQGHRYHHSDEKKLPYREKEHPRYHEERPREIPHPQYDHDELRHKYHEGRRKPSYHEDEGRRYRPPPNDRHPTYNDHEKYVDGPHRPAGYDPNKKQRFPPEIPRPADHDAYDEYQGYYRGENNQEDVYVTPIPPTKAKPRRHKHKKRKIPNKQKEIKKLQEIAQPKIKVEPSFKCPRDGHFGDQNDCAKFYRCAHGKAMVEYCPGGLFWNAVSDQCDWPETVDCSYNSVAMESYKVKKPTTLYLTFDDGPNEGTDAILKALRNEDVKATFFINSRNLHDPKKKEENIKNLLNIVRDGHVLADHSYDHMYHNSQNSPRNAYMSVEEDEKYFGIMNIYPVLDVLWKANLKDWIGPVNHTMTYFVRMPYTNNWRVGPIHKDCYACTIPSSSGQKGVEITNILHGKGKQIIGWDLEWDVDWGKNRFKYGGKEMFFRMARDERFLKSKMVLLSHDIAHRRHELRDEQRELETFIRLAKNAGYRFDTIEKY